MFLSTARTTRLYIILICNPPACTRCVCSGSEYIWKANGNNNNNDIIIWNYMVYHTNSSESVNGSSELLRRNRIKYSTKKCAIPDLRYIIYPTGPTRTCYNGQYNNLSGVSSPVDLINIVKFKP